MKWQYVKIAESTCSHRVGTSQECTRCEAKREKKTINFFYANEMIRTGKENVFDLFPSFMYVEII